MAKRNQNRCNTLVFTRQKYGNPFCDLICCWIKYKGEVRKINGRYYQLIDNKWTTNCPYVFDVKCFKTVFGFTPSRGKKYTAQIQTLNLGRPE